MGRPLKHLDSIDPMLADFAMQLRAAKRVSGLTLAQMAKISSVSESLLSTVHSGSKMPSWAAVCAYVEACGLSPSQVRRDWEQLRSHTASTSPRMRIKVDDWIRGSGIQPHLQATEPELVELLRLMKNARGLSLRQIAEDESSRYSHCVYGNVLRGARRLDADIMNAILRCCGVTNRDIFVWLRVLVSACPEEFRAAARLLYVVPEGQPSQFRTQPSRTRNVTPSGRGLHRATGPLAQR